MRKVYVAFFVKSNALQRFYKPKKIVAREREREFSESRIIDSRQKREVITYLSLSAFTSANTRWVLASARKQ